jgi:benzoyl-CoA reductase/2-hydroxyglutaryl-CoA dehydratase subunit BcrC/BadD/HgdB
VEGTQITGANYASWWNLDYSGDTVWDMLYHAYNFTILNLTGETRTKLINNALISSNADGVIINRNKSCKRDLSSLNEFNCALPCVVIESDMIDGSFIDLRTANERIRTLIDTL